MSILSSLVLERKIGFFIAVMSGYFLKLNPVFTQQFISLQFPVDSHLNLLRLLSSSGFRIRKLTKYRDALRVPDSYLETY